MCHVCKIWGDEPDGGACEDCPHAYHDRCLEPEFRGRHYQTCTDLGYECNPNAPAVHFLFGKRIDSIITKSRKKKAFKKRSSRSSNKRKRRDSIICGPGAVTNKEYHSFIYNHVEYRKGDDVVVAMSDQEGGWGVARITKISQRDVDRIPLLHLIWFWRATEVTLSFFVLLSVIHSLHSLHSRVTMHKYVQHTHSPCNSYNKHTLSLWFPSRILPLGIISQTNG